MESKIPQYLLEPQDKLYEACKGKKAGLSFLDKTILNTAKTVKSIYIQEESAAEKKFIQKVHPHVKLISLIYLAVVISLVNSTEGQLLIFLFVFSLYLTTRLGIFNVYRKIFLIAFIFGFLVVLPASLNVITPGKIVFNLITFDKPSHFWIYNIPQNIGFTENGFEVVFLVFLRVLNSVSLAMLIVFTTHFPSFIKSFKILGVPDTFLMIISLAYKYIFILSRTIEETYFALKSRLTGNIQNNSIRKLIGGRIFFIFKKSMKIYEDTYNAMVSRGYKGKAKLYSRSCFSFMDFVALIVIIVFGMVVIFVNIRK